MLGVVLLFLPTLLPNLRMLLKKRAVAVLTLYFIPMTELTHRGLFFFSLLVLMVMMMLITMTMMVILMTTTMMVTMMMTMMMGW